MFIMWSFVEKKLIRVVFCLLFLTLKLKCGFRSVFSFFFRV